MRSGRKGFTEPELVTTKKSTANGLMWLLTPTMDTATIKEVRPAVEVTNISADVKVALGWVLSDDGETWPASTAAPGLFDVATIAAQTTEGVFYATAFENIASVLTKKFVRFGAWIKNDSGSTYETALVSVRLEFKKF